MIRLASYHQELVSLIHLLLLLLVSGHEPVLWLMASFFVLRVIDLEDQRLLRLLLPDDSELRQAYVRLLDIGLTPLHYLSRLLVLLFSQLPLLQVLLVLLSLGVSQVTGLVHVESQAQSALEGSKVIPHQVRVTHQICCLLMQLADSLAPDLLQIRCRGKTTDAFSSDSVLSVHFDCMWYEIETRLIIHLTSASYLPYPR